MRDGKPLPRTKFWTGVLPPKRSATAIPTRAAAASHSGTSTIAKDGHDGRPGRRGSRRGGRHPHATSRRPAGRGCAPGAGCASIKDRRWSPSRGEFASGPRLSRIHSSISGRARAQMLTVGIEPTPDALDHAPSSFCSSKSCGWVSISNCSVTSKSCASSRAIEISCSGRPRIGSPIDAAGLGEGVERAACRHVAGGEMHLGDPAVIAREKADQHVGEVEAGLAVEPAHDAEIDHGDCAVGIDEHVAGVEIGMEKAVAEYLVEERVGRLAQDILDPVPGGEERGAVVDADAGDPLDRQHGAARAQPIDAAARESSGRRRNSPRARRRPPPRSADPSRARPTSTSVCTTSTGFSRRNAGRQPLDKPASQRNRSRSRAKARRSRAAIP